MRAGSSRPGGRRSGAGLAIAVALAGLLGPVDAAAQSISNTQSLSFGAFIPGTGGTVVVDTAGARTATGGVVLLTAAQFGTARAASYTVTNNTNGITTFTVTLPATSATLTRTGGTETMTVDTFTSNPATGQNVNKKGNGTLTNGSATLTVGATLTVNANQAVGTYTGTFSVTVAFP